MRLMGILKLLDTLLTLLILILTPLTVMLFVFLHTLVTLPTFPLSLPAMTLTTSPRTIVHFLKGTCGVLLGLEFKNENENLSWLLSNEVNELKSVFLMRKFILVFVIFINVYQSILIMRCLNNIFNLVNYKCFKINIQEK